MSNDINNILIQGSQLDNLQYVWVLLSGQQKLGRVEILYEHTQ